MRRLLPLLLLVPLLVACTPPDVTVSPSNAIVYVGEDAVLRATRTGSHPCCEPWDIQFYSTSESIALVQGRLQAPDSRTEIHVLGLTPGFTRVRMKGSYGDRAKAIVEVVCGPETPIRALAQPDPISFGESVTLHVISQSTAPRVFSWYLGRTGDKSKPLPLSGTDVTYKPDRAGTLYVWASADSACSSTAAEFRIDVASDRNRAVRH